MPTPAYRLVLKDATQANEPRVQHVMSELGLRLEDDCIAGIYPKQKAHILSQALARRGVAVTLVPPDTQATSTPSTATNRMLMRINVALCTSVLILLGLYFFTTPRASKASQAFGGHAVQSIIPEGELAPEAPRQQVLESPQTWEHRIKNTTYQVEALAHYELEARVLNKKRYRYDRMARLAPWDFVLGWQAMSDNRWLEHIAIRQQGRWYHWQALDNVDNAPIDSDISLSSANVHMIPANDYIRQRLARLQEHQLVHFEGYLVNIHDDNNYLWQSSLRRDDEGLGACEIFWLTQVRILPHNYFLH